MKKRFLLGILPALLALSSCTFMESATVVKGNEFLEDTLAHDELFAGQRALQPKRAIGDIENPDTDSDPAIGIQSIVQDGKVSFRFVAAVAFDTCASA